MFEEEDDIETIVQQLIERLIEEVEENELAAATGDWEDEYNDGAVEEAEEEESRTEQIGGSRVRIHRVTEVEPLPPFKNFFILKKVDVELDRSMLADPRGPELFADLLVGMVQRFRPPSANSSSFVGIVFHSDELDNGESIGLSVRPIGKVDPKDIVRTMGELAQSGKSPMEIKVPRLRVELKYITPPTGSGKRKAFGMDRILELEAFGKRRRRRCSNDEDDGDDDDEDIIDDGQSTSFFDDVAEASGMDEDEDEEEDEEEEDDEDSERRGRSKARMRENIMANNVEYDCLPHALYQAWMYNEVNNGATLDERTNARRMYRASLTKSDARPNKNREVYKEVRKMKKKAGILKTHDFDCTDIEVFQEKVFAGIYQIVAIVEDQIGVPYFAGPYVGPNKTITIFLDRSGHFAGVRKLPALLGTKYYCATCNARYGNIANHYSCPNRHRPCGSLECPIKEDDLEITCIACTVTFRSTRCFENHKEKGSKKGKSRCDFTKCCKKCDTIYFTNKTKVCARHECGTRWCERCLIRVPDLHHCTMRPSKKEEKKLTRKRIYYDFESTADPETGEQKPVLFIALRACAGCSGTIPETLEDALEAKCETCGPDGRCKVIECVTDENRHVNVAAEATDWLFGKEHKGFVGLAHNSSGYDGQFILRNLIWRKRATPHVTTAGTKIIYLKHKMVKLLDSLKYLTMSLASIGKTFKINVAKGDFPVLFIKPENFDYVGPIPDDEYFNLENKDPDSAKKLKDFIEEQRASEKVFNFSEELHKYCYSDVYILASALAVFEKDFEQVTNVCLFEESVTAASAALKVFQRNHLDHFKPIVLDARPSVSIKCSVMSQQWMAWFGEEENVQVEASTTYGERKVGGVRVDGFVEPCDKYPRGLVVEFMGCYWHAHECRYSQHSIIGGLTGAEIRARDEKRIEELKKLHDVKVVWECEVTMELRMDKKMAEFFESYEPIDLLQCEKALVGGRTEVFRLIANCIRAILKYFDIVSLYPTVMKCEAFPIGPPTNVHRSQFELPIIEARGIRIRGFISCRILPPRRLQLPVLPLKTGGKLIFALCRACARAQNQSSCNHSDMERSFNGTYTTVELKKAVEMGYTIISVYHAVEYKNWAQNDEKGEGGLFTSYVNEMMVEKIYSSGWPSNVKTDEQKKRFADGYLQREGIKVDDFSRFAVRLGARQAAKLLLNSLWGKFAQRVDRTSTEIVNTPAKFWKILYDSTIVIEDVWLMNDTLMVRHRKKEEMLKSLKSSAVHIAAYVTSYARLRLYSLLEKVGAENIIYCDTDSVIYSVPRGTADPLVKEVGPYLGQLTNELSGKMTDFVSLGPKTYCYKEVLSNGEEKIVRKAKGITLTNAADKKVTFQLMEKMVEEVLKKDDQPTMVKIPQQTMRRDRNHKVYCGKTMKSFRFTFNKRRVMEDGSTLPFGFCD